MSRSLWGGGVARPAPPAPVDGVLRAQKIDGGVTEIACTPIEPSSHAVSSWLHGGVDAALVQIGRIALLHLGPGVEVLVAEDLGSGTVPKDVLAVRGPARGRLRSGCARGVGMRARMPARRPLRAQQVRPVPSPGATAPPRDRPQKVTVSPSRDAWAFE